MILIETSNSQEKKEKIKNYPSRRTKGSKLINHGFIMVTKSSSMEGYFTIFGHACNHGPGSFVKIIMKKKENENENEKKNSVLFSS